MVFQFSSRQDGRGDRVADFLSPKGVIAGVLAQAELEDVEAYYALGRAYLTGADEVAADPIEALKWFHLAAAQGHTDATIRKAQIAGSLTDCDIHEAQSRARLWQVVNRSLAA